MLSYETLAVTAAEADAYATLRAWTNWTGEESAKTAALRRGQDYIAGLYNSRWNIEFDNETAPQVVIYAIIEAARRELAAPGSLMPDVVGTERVLREKVGDLEVQYADAKEPDDARPRLPIIDGLLAGLIRDAGNVTTCFLARA
ncbi:DnaT-like ssDNA-binding protein [Aliihoeflea sp. 2WW]|uniref:DnaT-like ssDNA-binding protein n=1 Tax=Aliihoeflea sp. 2WW TaxID=1381123 RepID=UPI000465C19E|nr:DnaT-like ssDNA-binding protein [Aliihoeflea sp. 2WW]